MRNVGIREVAQLAGVSVTTVSHVLNNTPQMRIAEETKTRVRDAAKTLGYGPNRIAKGLRTNKSGLIGLLSEEIATTPHAGRIILGAQNAAREHGLNLLIVNTDRDSGDLHGDDLQVLIDNQVEGILYATMYHREVVLPPNLHGRTTVLIDARESTGIVPSVVPNEIQGATTAVTHLIEAGHRRIGFLNNSDDVPATHERLIGYKNALKNHGINLEDGLILQSPSEANPAFEIARKLLSRADRPTALFCYNDRMAMGAYRAAAELGINIPKELSIIGFDNQELIADNLYPGLTTIALPHYEMGVWAVENFVRQSDGEKTENQLEVYPVRLECPLVIRNSVAPPKKNGKDL